MGLRARAALGTAIAAVLAFTLGLIKAYNTPEHDITNKDLLLALLFSLAGVVLINLAVTAVQEYLADRDKNEIIQRIDLLPGLIARHADLVIFPDKITGFRYCIEACAKAKLVRNNVLRYGYKASANPRDPAYLAWRSAKEKSIESLEVSWKEIVSIHLEESDGQVEFSKRMSQHGASYYDWRYIDDTACPMVQMTSFEFDAHKEVIFGWEFPGAWRGVSVLTRNPEVVAYFDNYFDYCFDRVAKRLDQANPRINPA